jgi:hypothetical protein
MPRNRIVLLRSPLHLGQLCQLPDISARTVIVVKTHGHLAKGVSFGWDAGCVAVSPVCPIAVLAFEMLQTTHCCRHL